MSHPRTTLHSWPDNEPVSLIPRTILPNGLLGSIVNGLNIRETPSQVFAAMYPATPPQADSPPARPTH